MTIAKYIQKLQDILAEYGDIEECEPTREAVARRARRLARFCELNAPTIFIENEVRCLVRFTMDYLHRENGRHFSAPLKKDNE
jgi:hypothetical protein